MKNWVDKLQKAETQTTPDKLENIKHLAEPQKIIYKSPDQGETTEQPHAVQSLLERIANGVEYLRSGNDESDGLFPIMRKFTAGSAGTISVKIATERPYILIGGVGGVSRGIKVSLGDSAAYPVGYIPVGTFGYFVLPFAEDLTLDYDTGTLESEVYILMSSRPVESHLISSAGTLTTISDGDPNPTVPGFESFNMVFDNASQTWKRWFYRGDTATTAYVGSGIPWVALSGFSTVANGVQNRISIADGDSQAMTRLLASGQYLYDGTGATGGQRQRTPVIFKDVNSAVVAGTPVAIWTPAAGKKFRLMGWALSLSVAGNIIFKDAATVLYRTPALAAGIGFSSPSLGNGSLSAVANNALNIDVSANGTVTGFVFGTEE